MSIELLCLLVLALFLIVLAIVSTAFYGNQVGNPALRGNREDIAPPMGAARRAYRAHENLLENLVPFAIVILAAQLLHVSTWLTQGAAVVFLLARVVHAPVYIAGVPVVRTIAWLTGVASTFAVAIAVIMS